MSYLTSPPTWRLCHPINIYVFRNGIETEKAQLVHIPMEKKKNMTSVLDAIAARMKFVAGYPIALYGMDGSRICKTYELQMYHYYVVVTNMEKRFKCVDYGSIKGPLVVIGSHSKHVKTLQLENRRYDVFCRRKAIKRLHELAPHGEHNGLGPDQIPPKGPPCGSLCARIAPLMNKPIQCCSDEIMNVDELVREPICDRGGFNEMADLMQRYQDVGSTIFKMFQDRINSGGNDDGGKWKLNSVNNSFSKIKEELKQMGERSCTLAFDKSGNYIGSDMCTNISQLDQSIPFSKGVSSVLPTTPVQSASVHSLGRDPAPKPTSGTVSQRNLSGKGSQTDAPPTKSNSKRPSIAGSLGAGSLGAGSRKRTSIIVQMIELDQENNVSDSRVISEQIIKDEQIESSIATEEAEGEEEEDKEPELQEIVAPKAISSGGGGGSRRHSESFLPNPTPYYYVF